MRGRADLMAKNSGQAHPRKEFSSGTAVVVTRCIAAAAKNSRKRSEIEFLDRR